MHYLFYSQFPSIVNLNVGGRHLTTSLSTLTKEPGSLLEAMFKGERPISIDQDGRYFIDADPDAFSHILNYLRVDLLPPAETALSVSKYAVHFRIDSLAKKLGSYAQVHGEKELVRHKAQYPNYENILSSVLASVFYYNTFNFQFPQPNLFGQPSKRECLICCNQQGFQLTTSDNSNSNNRVLAVLLQNDLRSRGYIANLETCSLFVHLTVTI